VPPRPPASEIHFCVQTPLSENPGSAPAVSMNNHGITTQGFINLSYNRLSCVRQHRYTQNNWSITGGVSNKKCMHQNRNTLIEQSETSNYYWEDSIADAPKGVVKTSHIHTDIQQTITIND